MLQGTAESVHQGWQARLRGKRWIVSTTGVALGLGMVSLYVALMTLGAPEPVLLAWTAVAAALAVVSLVGGLTVLAAIAPFTEALTDEGRITAVPFLLAALGLGLLISLGRAAIRREQLGRPPLPLWFAVALFLGTLASVGTSTFGFGPARGYEALQAWVVGLGGAITVLLAGAWVARRGSIAPVMVVGITVSLAATISVVDAWSEGGIQDSAVGWLVRGGMVGERLGGVIPAPNAFAAMLLVASSVFLAVLLFRRAGLGESAAALVGLIPISAALAYTLSRSALLGIALSIGLAAWRWRPMAAVLLGVVALVLAVAAAPGLLTARGGPVLPGFSLFTSSGDPLRFEAWSAAAQMFVDAPLTGHGLRSFEWLHDSYGSPQIDAPHNEWLRLFAEGGVAVGLAAIAFAFTAVRQLMTTPGWVAAAAAGAAAALFVMATFNNPWLYVQLNVPAFAVIGMGLGSAWRVAGSRR